MGGSGGTSARLDDRGRVVLPATLRRRLGLRAGDELLVREEAGGVLRLESRRVAARALIGLAGSAQDGAVERLRDERRRQAGQEEADAKRFER